MSKEDQSYNLASRPRLERITVQGWKSIKSIDNFPLDKINVLIGANGAGKSNFISLFRMLSWMTQGNLEFSTAVHGGANGLLHQGAAVTSQFVTELRFRNNVGVTDYHIKLIHAAGDTFVIADELVRQFPTGSAELNWITIGPGHRESRLEATGRLEPKPMAGIAKFILATLRQCLVYQFHNTSETSRMKLRWDINDSYVLKDDAGNLAPFLMRLQGKAPKHYGVIVDTLRQILPFFQDFELTPNENTVLLQWRERGSDMVFGAHQASDGMLRTMALVSLLLQPVGDLPSVLILDEPELGLHPFAIGTIGGLLRAVSATSQVIVATQSTTFIDQFEPHEIIVVDRKGSVSEFKRLNSADLNEWLQDYSLSELWEKNVIGGRP